MLDSLTFSVLDTADLWSPDDLTCLTTHTHTPGDVLERRGRFILSIHGVFVVIIVIYSHIGDY